MSKAKATLAGARERPGAERLCSHPDCSADGLYRAPRSHHALDDYIWFCLDHVREYNRAWDYFSGMTTSDIETHTRADMVGWRPTWPLGRLGAAAPQAKREETAHRRRPGARANDRARKAQDDPFARMRDPFGFFAEDGPAAGAGGRRANGERSAGRNGVRDAEAEALETLGLNLPLTRTVLRARYKELVKRFHPDANGGDKTAEERLKLINQAYATLKNSVSAP